MNTCPRHLASILSVCYLIFFVLGEVEAQTVRTHRMANSRTQQRGQPQQTRTRESAVRNRKAVRPASAQAIPASAQSQGHLRTYPEMVAPGAMDVSMDPIPMDTISYSDAHVGCDSCGMANQCCCNPAGFLFDWKRADLWMGVASFTGESNFLTTGSDTDAQVAGNFGFQEGFNFGSRMPSLLGGQVGAQLGMRFTQSQFDGTSAGMDSRTQTFITAGLFRRVDYGFQGGLVVDYLHDDWVYQADLLQLRGELSFLFSPCHDFGFRFTDNQQTDDTTASIRGRTTPLPIQLETLNNYRFFYRYRFSERGRGVAELQAGFTEDEGTILGVDLKTPLQNQLGLQTSATYLIPPSDASDAYTREGWNIGLAIVWTPGRVFGTGRDYYRPLFDVADNGSMLTRLTR